MKDVMIRTVRTWLEAALGLILAAWGTDISIGTIRACALAAVPAALAFLLNALETQTAVNAGPRG